MCRPFPLPQERDWWQVKHYLALAPPTTLDAVENNSVLREGVETPKVINWEESKALEASESLFVLLK